MMMRIAHCVENKIYVMVHVKGDKIWEDTVVFQGEDAVEIRLLVSYRTKCWCSLG